MVKTEDRYDSYGDSLLDAQAELDCDHLGDSDSLDCGLSADELERMAAEAELSDDDDAGF